MTYQPSGIIHITGEPDTGKTLLALGAYHPQNTCYFFDDVKRPPVDKDHFGLFVDMVQDWGDLKVLELYKAVMDKIDSLPQFDSIVFDTWARTGKAVRYYAKANPYEFREQSTFSASGMIKNMEQWGEAHLVEAAIISKLSRKCKALFLITHIKEKIIAGARSGLMEPDCGRSFDRVCNLRLWLRHNEHSGVPIALVLKRLSKATLGNRGIEVVNVLPRRIKPLEDDTSVWDAIGRYWDDPTGNKEPAKDEKPTKFELSILDGILTDDQKEVWRAELRAKEIQEKEQEEFFSNQWAEQQAKAKELASDKSGPPPIVAGQILKEMRGQWPELSQADVVSMLE